MGLDMYLTGEKFYWKVFADHTRERSEDGFKVESVNLELGYWRKHPNLHGYIVKTFAKGVDQCQRIDLTANDIRNIMRAVRTGKLPHTEGFFFGSSSGDVDEIAHDLSTFEAALTWLEAGGKPPAVTEPPQELGGGLVATKVKVDPEAKEDRNQRVTRSVFYKASW